MVLGIFDSASAVGAAFLFCRTVPSSESDSDSDGSGCSDESDSSLSRQPDSDYCFFFPLALDFELGAAFANLLLGPWARFATSSSFSLGLVTGRPLGLVD